jgi:hypothetical protein
MANALPVAIAATPIPVLVFLQCWPRLIVYLAGRCLIRGTPTALEMAR